MMFVMLQIEIVAEKIAQKDTLMFLVNL